MRYEDRLPGHGSVSLDFHSLAVHSQREITRKDVTFEGKVHCVAGIALNLVIPAPSEPSVIGRCECAEPPDSDVSDYLQDFLISAPSRCKRVDESAGAGVAPSTVRRLDLSQLRLPIGWRGG